MFSLLFCVAVLLAGLKCKIELENNDGSSVSPSNECKAEAHNCFGAECTAAGTDKKQAHFYWGCLGGHDAKICASILEDGLGEETKNGTLGKWTCKCFVAKVDKDLDNERFEVSYDPDTRRLEMFDNESTESKIIRDVKSQMFKLEEALRKLDRVKTTEK
uniref:Uncharacterized protein n=1 Tax=Globodera rostochiensis TaxID=31243 RepID=A0A914GZJ4_GLORO